jgi:hypothetical protein
MLDIKDIYDMVGSEFSDGMRTRNNDQRTSKVGKNTICLSFVHSIFNRFPEKRRNRVLRHRVISMIGSEALTESVNSEVAGGCAESSNASSTDRQGVHESILGHMDEGIVGWMSNQFRTVRHVRCLSTGFRELSEKLEE